MNNGLNAESLYLCGFSAFTLLNGSRLDIFMGRIIDWKGDNNETIINLIKMKKEEFMWSESSFL